MSHAIAVPAAPSLYDEDFFGWTQDQARLLRERRFAELDLENLTAEVESAGRSQKSEIRNRLSVLMAHLLKWKYQPGRRSTAWTGTILEQRRRLGYLLEDSPSLRRFPPQACTDSYLSARLLAAGETGIDISLFPETPPFTIEQVLDDGFLPKEPELYDQS